MSPAFIQWLGIQNCEEVFAFLGWEHPDDETDHSVIYLNDGTVVRPGDWIVQISDDEFGTWPDESFRTTPAGAGHD